MTKRISFLMPTFNRADYIAEAINAIAEQMSGDDEIIVVDDGSTDGTHALLSGLSGTITHLRQDNAGKSAALNLAMSHASGEYIWICDDDDVLCPGAATTLLELIEQSGAGFVFGRYSKFTHHGGSRVDLGMAHWPELHEGSPARHILEDAFVMHNAALVRRSLYDAVGPFDPAMLRAQDYDMFVRLAMHSESAFTPQTIFHQRKHEGARGPTAIQHAAGASNSVWQDFDRRIFQRVYTGTPLTFFEGLFEGDDPALVKRAALLQRATVMARHDLWGYALDDWAAACEVAGGAPLQQIEKDICRRAVAGKHGFAGALEGDTLSALLALKHSGETGGSMVRGIVSGLVWRLRDPEQANRPLAWQLIGKLQGRNDLFRAVASRLLPKTPSVPQTVIERSGLPSK